MSARTEEHAASNWPANIEAEKCFLVQSPNRVVYMYSEEASKTQEWVEKLLEAKEKVCLVC